MDNYEQAVAREEENRLLAYLGVGRPIFGRLLAQLTWRHVLELSLAQNAFFTSSEPTTADVYDFLWALDIHFQRPDGSLPNWPKGAKRPGWWAVRGARVDCYRISRSASPNRLERPIRQWIEENYQDMPSGDPGANSAPSSLLPRLNWFDTVVSYYGRRGPAEILALPVAVTFQMIRADLINRGEEARCIPPSAKLKRFEE